MPVCLHGVLADYNSLHDRPKKPSCARDRRKPWDRNRNRCGDCTGGWNVVVNFRERGDAANSVCSEILKMGRRAIVIQADVSVSADVKRMVAQAENSLGKIDILVNNAAIANPRKFEQITEEEWDTILAVNLKSVFLMTQAVVRGMREREWPNYKSVFGRRTDRRCCRGALCGIEGRNHRTDALLRRSLRPARHHSDAIAPALVETDMVTSNPNASPSLIPMGPLRQGGRCGVSRRNVGDERIHHGSNNLCERRMVHDVVFRLGLRQGQP